MKYIFLNLLLAISFNVFPTSENRNKDKTDLREYVYTITIASAMDDKNQRTQTAFKIENHHGLWTSLHGFVACFSESDTSFKNYKVVAIRNYKNSIIYRSTKAKESIIVSKIDLEKDVAFISTKALGKEFNDGKGFRIGYFNEGKITNTSIISMHGGVRLNLWNYHIGGFSEVFREQISSLDDEYLESYKRLRIPHIDCQVITNNSEKLCNGDSGSPIIINDTIIAIAQASFADFRSWAVLFNNTETLLSYNQLGDPEKKILKDANENYKMLGKHDNFKSLKRNSVRMESPKGFYHFVIIGEDSNDFFREYKDIKKPKRYNYVNSLPEIILYHLETGYAEDLKLAYRILISKEKDNSNKFRKVRNRVEKYEFTLRLLKAVYLYHIYTNELKYDRPPSTSAYDSLMSSAQYLHTLIDTKKPKLIETAIWRKSGFDYYDKVYLLFKDILNLPRNAAKFHDPKDNDTSDIKKHNENLVNHKIQCNKLIQQGDSLMLIGQLKLANNFYLSARESKCVDESLIGKIKNIQNQLSKDSIIDIMPAYIKNYMQNLFLSGGNYEFIPLMDFDFEFYGEKMDSGVIKIFYGQSNNDFKINTMFYSFPPGKAVYSGSIKAINIIKSTLIEVDTVFSKIIDRPSYNIAFIGHADGLKYKGSLSFDKSDFGDIEGVRIRNQNGQYEKLNFMIFADSDKKNKALAFLRAYHAKLLLEKSIYFLKPNQNTIFYETHQEKGGDYRKVEININFKINR